MFGFWRSFAKHVLLVVLLCGSANANESAPKNELRPVSWGFINFPPYNYLDERNRAVGSLVGEVKQVMDLAGVNYDVNMFPNRRLYQMLNSGNVDFTVSITNILTNKDDFVISQFPVTQVRVKAFWVGEKPPVNNINDLRNKRVILISGYTYGQLREQLESPRNKVRVAANIEQHKQAVEALIAGRADYLIDYGQPVELLLESNSWQQVKSSTINTYDMYYILSRKYPDAKKVMQRLEQAYANLFVPPDDSYMLVVEPKNKLEK